MVTMIISCGQWSFKYLVSCKIFNKFHGSLFSSYLSLSLAFFTRLSQTLIFGVANQVSKSLVFFVSDFIKNFRMSWSQSNSCSHLKHFEVLVSLLKKSKCLWQRKMPAYYSLQLFPSEHQGGAAECNTA